MAKLDALPEQAIISGYKGKLDFYLWMGIAVCRAWPRSPGKKRSVDVEAQWIVFKDAAQIWNTLSQIVQDAYNTMASGSTLSGRDVATKMYINSKFILPY